MAYHKVSPAPSLGSGIPSDLHGTRPIAPATQAPASVPVLSVSGHGSSPGRMYGDGPVGVREADHPINASLALESSISTFCACGSVLESENNDVELKRRATKPTMIRSAVRIIACPR